MAEKKYIERASVLESISELTWYSKNKKGVLHIGAVNRKEAYYPAGNIFDVLEKAPAADVVSRSAYDQIRWERNIAMQQLDEAGIPFGGKSDKEYAPVVHAEWEFRNNGRYGQTICYCSACGKHSGFFGSVVVPVIRRIAEKIKEVM